MVAGSRSTASAHRTTPRPASDNIASAARTPYRMTPPAWVPWITGAAIRERVASGTLQKEDGGASATICGRANLIDRIFSKDL
jgi:hypothetical protein